MTDAAPDPAADDASDDVAPPDVLTPDASTIELVDVLSRKYPESSRTTLRGMIADKRVLVDGRLARTLKQPVAPTCGVTLLPRVEARQRYVGNLPFHVVFEDRDLLVIDKPAGIITSSGDHDKRSTLIEVIENHYAQIDGKVTIGLIHRLDKDASGLLVFSKNPAAFDALKAQFADRTAKRSYVAIVYGKPAAAAGRIESKLVEHADGTVRSTRHRDYGEQAITHYQTIESRGRHTMLRVDLETGRKHQIRAHLAERDTPIAGDAIYHAHANMAPRLMLVAVELTLAHPRTAAKMTWTLELPKDVAAWWDAEKTKRNPKPKPKAKSQPKDE